MRDEIGQFYEQLRAQRPALDTSASALSDRVTRAARLVEHVRRQALRRRDLEVWEYEVLLALRALSPSAGLSPGALMAATQVASGTMTNRVDRLARRGFVSREPDPADRRGVLVRLRTAGRRRVDLAAADVAEAEHALWGQMPARRQDQLARLLAETVSAFD